MNRWMIPENNIRFPLRWPTRRGGYLLLSTETHCRNAVGISDLFKPGGVWVTALLIKVRYMDFEYYFLRRVLQLHIACHY